MNFIDIPNANQAREMSQWLTDQGLTHMKDYAWYLDSKHEMIRITFSDKAASYIPLFLLKWAE